MKLFLQANDTFFFRDGRPFTKGEQSEGHSIFPPLPSTLLGALRTAYIVENGDLSSFYDGDMENSIGTPKSLGSMCLKGVFLADTQQGVYYPIPLDVVGKTSENDEKLYVLKVRPQNSDFISNSIPILTHHLVWEGTEDVEVETEGKLDSINMMEYLLNRQNEYFFRHHKDFVQDEPKTGIQRDNKLLASDDGMLYRINMSRFQNRFFNPTEKKALSELGFIVDHQCNLNLSEQGLLKLGGEGRSFFYKQSSHNPNPFNSEDAVKQLKEKIQESGIFKLYFAAPAIFDQGWLPKWISKKTFKAQYSSLSFELITAAVGKPISISGWNMKDNIPKPTRQAVPAGSVYYFKVIKEQCVDTIFDTFHYRNISDFQAAEGYGLCFVGAAKGVQT